MPPNRQRFPPHLYARLPLHGAGHNTRNLWIPKPSVSSTNNRAGTHIPPFPSAKSLCRCHLPTAWMRKPVVSLRRFAALRMTVWPVPSAMPGVRSIEGFRHHASARCTEPTGPPGSAPDMRSCTRLAFPCLGVRHDPQRPTLRNPDRRGSEALLAGAVFRTSPEVTPRPPLVFLPPLKVVHEALCRARRPAGSSVSGGRRTRRWRTPRPLKSNTRRP